MDPRPMPCWHSSTAQLRDDDECRPVRISTTVDLPMLLPATLACCANQHLTEACLLCIIFSTSFSRAGGADMLRHYRPREEVQSTQFVSTVCS